MKNQSIEIDLSSLDTLLLFTPRDGKTIRKSYREIEGNPKFKINDSELLFAWYIGIRNSPIDEKIPAQMRWKMAAAKSFPNNKEKKDQYADGDFPDEVKEAIKEFSKFSPEARLIANKINQTAIKNFMALVNADPDDFYSYRDVKDQNGQVYQVKEMDYQARKQYVSTVAEITKVLPDLLKQSEDGFGVTEDKNTDEKVGVKPIDEFHREKRDKNS